MKRAAEASPDGARRTAAIAVLTPFVAISNALRITDLTDGVEEALGRDPDEAPGGGIVVPPEALPSVPGEGSEEDSGGEVHARGPIRKPTGKNKLRVAVMRSCACLARAASPLVSRARTTSTGPSRCRRSSTTSSRT